MQLAPELADPQSGFGLNELLGGDGPPKLGSHGR